MDVKKKEKGEEEGEGVLQGDSAIAMQSSDDRVPSERSIGYPRKGTQQSKSEKVL